MPIQRRLPKFGFTSHKALVTAEIRLDDLIHVDADVVNLASLKDFGIINASIKFAKIIAAGEINKAVRISGIGVTRGARAAIEAAGGKIEE